MPSEGFECPTDAKLLDHEICYGTLYDAMAKALGNTRTSDSPVANVTGPFTHFRVQPKDHIHILCYGSQSEFAVLDTQTTSRLNALSRTPKLRFDAVVESNIFSKRQRGTKQIPRTFPLSINIFGLKSTADDVAYRLSKVSAFLQHPQSLRIEVEYHNPQLLTFTNDDSSMRDLVGIGNNPLQSLNISIIGEVGRILESLTHTDIVSEKKLELPAGLLSKLKIHQEDGVHFILSREEKAVSQQLSSRLRQLIRVDIDSPLSMCLGGLIADVMGLGKTLTMLTAILQSMPVAEDFANFYEEYKDELMDRVRTKATLVVVSSVQLLESWISEIQTHFSPDTLSFVCFHGQDRPRDSKALKSVGLVLTTYATLAADYAGQCILDKVEWYRVVLDEAHWIRNSSSKQFRAAAGLYTRRRWCLTGTPIQNKLDDLTSIAQFLRLPPLSTKTAFQKHILGPLSEGGSNFAKPLRGYLEAYCLRRSEKCVTLPPSWSKDVTLHLSSEEQQLYDRILDKTRRQIDSLVSKRDKSACNKLFTAMLRMRMLCNLGTFSWVRASKGLLGRRNLDIGCERCSASDEDTLMLLEGSSFCPDCQRPLGLSSPLPSPADDQISTAEASCRDVDMILDKAAGDLTLQKSPSMRHGFSTKLNAVVQNVSLSGPGDKSIVFSYWTSTLDLISQLLGQAKVAYRQVDGRTSYAERSKALKAFKEDCRGDVEPIYTVNTSRSINGVVLLRDKDPEVPVLLMSIETGAVGLNLTVANKVHIVEPQWNPSVEEQAIARALRMGQTREVTIIRYVVENTVEQNIINLQQKKKRLAKLTFDIGTEAPPDMLGDLRIVLNIDSK
ncbi:SNF2 family N-terminal domain-containing protein [Xylaria flabelliformis]|nr:SNF2 family N-terminal domain-containing protein [Xylaria flabelliformis]